MSESEKSAQARLVVGPKLVATLSQVVVAVPSQAAVASLSQVAVASLLQVVVAMPSQVVLQATRPSVAVAKLSQVVSKWLLLLLPEDLFALVAEGSQVLVGFADTRLLAGNDWVVWSPLVITAAMAALGLS